MMKRAYRVCVALLAVVVLQAGCGGDAPKAETKEQAPVPVVVSASPKPSASAGAAFVPDEPLAASAFVVIQNAGSRNADLLVQQLQQVLPKTQVVKKVKSPNAREIRLEVTNTKDVRALANKIPFASVETVDDKTRTITVDFDL